MGVERGDIPSRGEGGRGRNMEQKGVVGERLRRGEAGESRRGAEWREEGRGSGLRESGSRRRGDDRGWRWEGKRWERRGDGEGKGREKREGLMSREEGDGDGGEDVGGSGILCSDGSLMSGWRGFGGEMGDADEVMGGLVVGVEFCVAMGG